MRPQFSVANDQTVLYSTQTAKKAYYPLPDALTQRDVLSFLHNHTALAHLFWPSLVTEVDERRASPTSTIFRIGSAATKGKATITTAADEAVCEEELPFVSE